MPEQRNLILAIVLSVTIILAFQYFYELPRIKDAQRQQPAPTAETTPPPSAAGAPEGVTAPVAPGTVTPGAVAPGTAATPSGQTIEQSLAAGQRVAIQSPRLHGSLALIGGLLNDVVL